MSGLFLSFNSCVRLCQLLLPLPYFPSSSFANQYTVSRLVRLLCWHGSVFPNSCEPLQYCPLLNFICFDSEVTDWSMDLTPACARANIVTTKKHVHPHIHTHVYINIYFGFECFIFSGPSVFSFRHMENCFHLFYLDICSTLLLDQNYSNGVVRIL